MWNKDEQKNVGQDGQPGDPKDPRAATLGASVCVKGAITASEDLTIDGQVEGRIDLPNHLLTIGPNATILGDVNATRVTVFGSIIGTIIAKDKVDLRKSGSVEGTVTCGRIAIQEGAHMSGKLTTQAQRKPKETVAAKVA